MIPRVLIKSKEKVFASVIVCIVVVCAIYLYNLQGNYKTVQWSEQRCFSELSSVKYQLNVVTEYKNRLDKLLMETQKSHESEKERFKDTMESCIAMKQQSAICQSQFEDLQSECKKVKEEFNKLIKVTDT